MGPPLIVPSEDTPPTAPPPDAPTGSERLTDCELAYHLYVIARVKLIAGLQAQITRATADIAAISGSRDSWMAHLQQRYGLDDGDQIVSDGRIIRVDDPPVAEG